MALDGEIKCLADGLVLPESPRWHDGALWFVDGARVAVIDREGNVRTHAVADCPILLGLSFLPDGDALTSDSNGRRVLKIGKEGSVGVFADLTAEARFIINEPMALQDGSVVVGDAGFDFFAGAPPEASRMIRVAPNGVLTRTGAPMLFSNGLVSLENGSGLLAAETLGRRIWRYRLVPGVGLDGGTVVAALDEPGLDGLAQGANDTLWYANIHSGEVVNLNSRGAELRRIATGFPHATSCVLGDNGKALYATVLRKRPISGLPCDGAVLKIRL